MLVDVALVVAVALLLADKDDEMLVELSNTLGFMLMPRKDGGCAPSVDNAES